MSTFARKQFAGSLFESGADTRQVGLVVDEIIGDQIIETFADGDTTPSVATPNALFKTSNTGATTITDLDDGYSGQIVTVLFGDANTTVDFTASGLVGNGGADWTPAVNDSMRCIYDGTDWYCCVCGASGGGGGSLPTGTAEGNTLYWDNTGGSWVENDGVQWDETNQRLKIGGNLYIEDQGTSVDWLNSGLEQIMTHTNTDGGVLIIQENKLRMAAGGTIAFFSTGGARPEIIGSSDGYLHFTADGGGTNGVKSDYGIFMTDATGGTAGPPSGYAGFHYTRGFGHSKVNNISPSTFSIPFENVNDRVWRFNNPTTASEPGTTFMRANTTDLSTITAFYFDEEDQTGQNVDIWFSRVAVGDTLFISQRTNYQTHWGYYEITSKTDNTTWWTVGVSHIASGDSGAGSVFSNGQACYVQLIPTSRMTAISPTVNVADLADTNISVSEINVLDVSLNEVLANEYLVGVGGATPPAWQALDISHDLTPQLGGNLDTNNFNINFGANDTLSFSDGTDSISFYADSVSGNLEVIETGGFGIIDVGSVATRIDNLRISDTGFIRSHTESGHELVGFDGVASAVNYVEVANSITANGPEIRAAGSDTNIDLELVPKGTGKVRVWDSTAADSADIYHDGTHFVLNESTGDGIEFRLNNAVEARFNADSLQLQEPIIMLEATSANAFSGAYGQFWVRNHVPNQAMFSDDAGNDYPLGYARYRTFANVSDTVDAGYINGAWYSDNATAYTLTLEASGSTNFPVGGQFTIWNEGTGTLTINEGSGDTLYVLTGSAVTDSAGGCTMAEGGYATVIRKSAATWLIMGAGITP